MITVPIAACIAEGVILALVIVVVVRLYLRVRALGSRTDGALAQMHEWVNEAEELSAALAERLHDRSYRAAEKPAPAAATAENTGVLLRFATTASDRLPAGARDTDDTDRLLEDRVAARAAEDPTADRRLAHEKAMDPAGVALQRLLTRDAGIA